MNYHVAVLIRGNQNNGQWRLLKTEGGLTSGPWLTFNDVTGLPISGNGGWNGEFSKEDAERKASEHPNYAVVIPVVN